MSDSDEREKKPRKPRKKKRIPGLPNRTVVIKNADKDKGGWMENWNYPKRRSPGHLPHPFRLLALGGVGRGKTCSVKNIFLRHQSSGKKFKKLIVLTCDPDSREWLDCEPDIVSDEMVSMDEFDPKVKTCLVIDDFEMVRCSKEDQRALSTLFRYVSSHRNVSIIVGFQSFFCVPPIIRKTANAFMIYKPTARGEATTIENRVGLDTGTLRSLFKGLCSGIYDHVFVDLTIGSPYPLRKNIYEPIEVDDSDDDE